MVIVVSRPYDNVSVPWYWNKASEGRGGLRLRENCAYQVSTKSDRRRYEYGGSEDLALVIMVEAKGIGEVVFAMRADGRVIRYGEQASRKTCFHDGYHYGDEYQIKKPLIFLTTTVQNNPRDYPHMYGKAQDCSSQRYFGHICPALVCLIAPGSLLTPIGLPKGRVRMLDRGGTMKPVDPNCSRQRCDSGYVTVTVPHG